MEVFLVKTVRKTIKDFWGHNIPVDEVVGLRRITPTGESVNMVVGGGNGEIEFVPIYQDADGVEYVCPPNVEGRKTSWFTLTDHVWWSKLDEHRKDRFVFDGEPITANRLLDAAQDYDYTL